MKLNNKKIAAYITFISFFIIACLFITYEFIDFDTQYANTEYSFNSKVPPRYYIINLDRSKGRLANAKKQFATYNISLERISAVDGYKTVLIDTTTNETITGKKIKSGKDILKRNHIYNVYCKPSFSFKEIQPDFRYKIYKHAPHYFPTPHTHYLADYFSKHIKTLTAGEIGCACSHRLIWRKVAASPNIQIAVIFEDDIKPYDNFDKNLEKIFNTLPPLWDIIYIDAIRHHTFLNKWMLTFKTANKNLLKISPWKNTTGTHAYIINRKSAQKLLELYKFEENSDLPVDEFLSKMIRNKKISAYISKEKIADTINNIPSEILFMGR